jgi:hypothetical protein
VEVQAVDVRVNRLRRSGNTCDGSPSHTVRKLLRKGVLRSDDLKCNKKQNLFILLHIRN